MVDVVGGCNGAENGETGRGISEMGVLSDEVSGQEIGVVESGGDDQCVCLAQLFCAGNSEEESR